MATSNQDFSGLLGDIFGGGGGATGLEDYLTPAQTAQMNRQALLQAAIAASQASGPSTTPRSFMQILGAGLAGGQQGYAQAQEGAIKQIITKQKLDEYKRQVADEQAYRDMFAQAPVAGGAITPMQAAALPVAQYGMGPSPQRAAMIGQPAPAGVAGMPSQGGISSLSQAQRDLLRSMPAKEGRAKLLELLQQPEITGNAFKGADGNYYYMTKQGPIPASVAPAAEITGAAFRAADGKFYYPTKEGPVPASITPAPKPAGQPQQVMGSDGKPALVQMYDDGSYKTVTGVSPLIPPEKLDTGGAIRFVDQYAIKPGTVFPKTLAPQVVGSAEGGYFAIGGGGGRGGMPTAPQAAPAPQVPQAFPTRGSRAPAAAPVAPAAAGPAPIIPGTGKAFANEKDLRTEFSAQVKPYTELAQAFRKVEAAALNPSAAGDISLVYGYMKILDPGSTVMQGEQATAQNAGSVPDSVRAMYNKALTGESLAPTIRQDFYAQARNIIESQRELSSDLINRYTNVAREYKLNPNQIVYDPFKRIKTPTEVAAEAAKSENKPKSNSTYTNQYGLTPRSN